MRARTEVRLEVVDRCRVNDLGAVVPVLRRPWRPGAASRSACSSSQATSTAPVALDRDAGPRRRTARSSA